jgi:iron(III) transport system permease protein
MAHLSIAGPAAIRPFSLDSGKLLLWGMILATSLLVLPPLLYLVTTSLTVQRTGAEPYLGWDNYAYVFRLSGWRLWRTTLLYAGASSGLAILFGTASAWLVARTDAPGRGLAVISAYLSLAAPVIIKGIGWILLLGPNKGVVNEFLRNVVGITGVPIELFSLGGMILLEAILWMPVVFLLTMPSLSSMDPALEEAAALSGARRSRVLARITLPLAAPAILSILLLTFIRALESFEVPLLIGVPGGLQTFTTAIFQTIRRGFVPRYGEASAYAVLLVLAMTIPLLFYYRATRSAQKYATISGKGFRPTLIPLGRWRWPAGLFLLLMPLALLAPLAILLWASFLPLYQPPSWADLGRFTLDNYAEVLSRPLTLDGLRNGLLVSGLSATGVTLLAFLLAWLVVRRREGARYLLDMLGSLPLVLPGIVLGTALLIEFLTLRFLPIYGTIWIMVIAFLIRFLPYGIRFSQAGISAIGQELEESARTAGAPASRMLRRIVLPLALPSLLAIWIYVFLYSIRDLSLPVLLAGPQNQLIAVVMLDLWNDGKIPQVGALSILLAATVSLLGWLLMRLGGRAGSRSF